MSINILGSEWNVFHQTLEENEHFTTCDGYCDPSVKGVFVRKYKNSDNNSFGYKNRAEMQKKVLRHEIVHAFMYESGLWRNSNMVEEGWSMNEEMVDWIAIQGIKMYKAWLEAGAI